MIKLVEAEEKHSPLLQAFFEEQVVHGHVDYSIRRPHNFFDHYKLLGNDFTTALLMDDETLLGAATICYQRAYFNRQEQTVGFLCDLRIAQQRVAVQQWAHHFIPYLYKKIEEKNCRYVFTAIEQFENQAYNALLRPRKIRRQLPHYYLYRKVNVIFFMGRWPWSPQPMPSIRVSHALPRDMEELCDYMMQKKIGSRLYFNITPDLLQQRFNAWPDFSLNNFLIARNSKNQIVGCMAPWNNNKVQQVVVKQYHSSGLLLYQSSKISSLLRWSQPMPQIGQAFQLKFLTHSAADNHEVFYSLLCQAYEESERGEILVHTNYFGDFITRAPQTFIATKIPYGFYSVLQPNEDLPTFLKPNPFSTPPDFNFVHI
ncbi:hypothetical protein K2X05_12490 [bacterium]|nr:hypothetical protein [bacterium]